MALMGSCDVLDEFGPYTATVCVTNVWRLKIGVLVLRLASWVLRSEITVQTSDECAAPDRQRSE